MAIVETLKTCCTCKTPKSVNSFTNCKSKPDGKDVRCKDCVRAYNFVNREMRRLYAQNYRGSHPGCGNKSFFRSRMNNLKVRHGGERPASRAELSSLWKRQRGHCAITGRRLTKENAELDHIIPVASGGKGNIQNLRWLHKDVNSLKRNMSDRDFYLLCKEVVEGSLKHYL
jgi:hypothetical protein